MITPPLRSAVPLALCVGLVAQSTWTVADSQQLQQAMDLAAPGDIIQLAAGGFFPDDFTLTRGVTVVGPGQIGGDLPFNGDWVVDVPPGEVAQFVEVRFEPNPIPIPESRWQGRLRVSGTIRLQGCTVNGAYGPAALVLTNAHAVLQRSTIRGDWDSHGIDSIDSDVAMTDCIVYGGNAYRTHYSGGWSHHGVRCRGSGSLHVTHSFVRGGSGWYAPPYAAYPPADAIVTDVPTWITDSTVEGGDDIGMSGHWGPGAAALRGLDARYARCTLTGGSGTTQGPATVGVVVRDPLLLGVTSSAIVTGGTFTIRFVASGPGVGVALVGSPGIAAPLWSPVLSQPYWLTGASFFVAGGMTGPTHEISYGFGVPSAASLVGQSFDFVGYSLGATAIESSPPAGGVVR